MAAHISNGKKWLMFGLVTAIGAFLDILTKYFAVKALVPGVAVSIIGEYAQFMLLFNRNAIFGLDPRGLFPGLQLNLVYYIFSTAAIILLLTYFVTVRGGWLTCWGIALIMPGALGNLYDRLLYPQRGVVDFIKLGISDRIYWPVFNLADAYITVGVGLILFELAREEFRRKKHLRQA